jgi:hypothetical protein
MVDERDATELEEPKPEPEGPRYHVVTEPPTSKRGIFFAFLVLALLLAIAWWLRSKYLIEVPSIGSIKQPPAYIIPSYVELDDYWEGRWQSVIFVFEEKEHTIQVIRVVLLPRTNDAPTVIEQNYPKHRLYAIWTDRFKEWRADPLFMMRRPTWSL